MQTEIENHDIFRDMLLELFESIREPEAITNHSLQDKILAFADFLTHLAYLKTIPCPSLNAASNIEFFKKTVIINE